MDLQGIDTHINKSLKTDIKKYSWKPAHQSQQELEEEGSTGLTDNEDSDDDDDVVEDSQVF